MRKLKYGVIGCAGRMGMAHLLFLNNVVADRVRVEALCDLDTPQAAACADLFPHDVRIFDDYRKLLEIDEIDAVLISTPNNTHKQIALDAFAAGKHVFCEKPLANTLGDCDEIITQPPSGAGGGGCGLGFELALIVPLLAWRPRWRRRLVV